MLMDGWITIATIWRFVYRMLCLPPSFTLWVRITGSSKLFIKEIHNKEETDFPLLHHDELACEE